VGGARILDRLVEVLRDALGADPILIANDPEATEWRPDLRVVADLRPGTGTLGGLYTAVMADPHPPDPTPVVVVAWDMPFVPPELIRHLASRVESCDVVIPASPSHRGVEPTCAAYSPVCGPAIERALDHDDLRAVAFHDAVETCILPGDEVGRFGDPATMFFNVNTPDELERANCLWRRQESSRS